MCQTQRVHTSHPPLTSILRAQLSAYSTKILNRSVVGVMTEFTHLAEVYRDSNPDPDLLHLALRLATTPCGPLYGRNVSPDRELGALLRSIIT
jgi:hypothetical protein